jgi:3-oxoacyl-[acyl-carrier-protein] synthase-1
MPAKQNNTDSQLAITAYGLKAVTGDQDFALYGAVATSLSAAAEDSNQEVPSPVGDGFDPALTAPMPIFEDLDPDTRILLGLAEVIIKASQHLIEKHLEDRKHLVLIVLPAEAYTRNQFIDTKEWQEIIKNELTEFSDLHFYFLKADANVVKHVQGACAKLNENEVESIIFAGSDSLLDQLTINELVENNKLCSNTISNGVIPGEAAASVVIQKITNKSEQPRAILKALSNSPEPNSGKAHINKMTGLTKVIQTVSQMAGKIPDDIDCVIRNNTTEQQSAYEWYQTTQSIWPNKLAEQDRVAYQLGEITEPPKLKARKMPEELLTSATLGDVGAASIPLSLVVACARFNFDHPVVNNCLICEANEFPFRGAILLENPVANSPVKA